MTGITLSEDLESIGESAFRNASITSITIPASVAFVGENAFRGRNFKRWNSKEITRNWGVIRLQNRLSAKSIFPNVTILLQSGYSIIVGS